MTSDAEIFLSTEKMASIQSLTSGWQDGLNKVQLEWATKLDDCIDGVKKNLQLQHETLTAREKELLDREAKLKEELKGFEQRKAEFGTFVKKEEERVRKMNEEFQEYEKSVEKLKTELEILKDEELKRRNEELQKKDAAAAKRELRLNKREIELGEREEKVKLLEERDAELEHREKILQEREGEIERRDKEFDDNMAKLRFHESIILRQEKEVQAKVKELGLEQDGAPQWHDAEEYMTSLVNAAASNGPDDKLPTKRALKILKCVAGKGKGDFQLSFSCTPKRIYEAKLAYRYGNPVNLIEVLSSGIGDSPLNAVLIACKAVQKKLLSVPTDSQSRLSFMTTA